MSNHATTSARWLWALAGVFAVRVAAQPLAAVTGWSALPPFEAWQSGALPYWLLAVLQVTLLAWMVRTARAVGAGRLAPSRVTARRLGAAAGIYGSVMGARLVLGATVSRGHWWLDAPLPTVFHLVITTYLGVLVHHHFREVPNDDGRT